MILISGFKTLTWLNTTVKSKGSNASTWSSKEVCNSGSSFNLIIPFASCEITTKTLTLWMKREEQGSCSGRACTPCYRHISNVPKLAIANCMSLWNWMAMIMGNILWNKHEGADRQTLEMVSAGLHCSLRMSKQILPLLLMLGWNTFVLNATCTDWGQKQRLLR